MHQLDLSFEIDEHYLENFLENQVNKSLSLVITDNSASMLSVRKKGISFTVRLHRIFLSAGEEVLKEIVSFIKDGRGKTPGIREFIKQNNRFIRKRPPAKVNISTRGKNFDLLEIFNSLNEAYFNKNISAFITWGRGSLRRAARKRTLGSFSSHNNMIRINPLLDATRVPRYFLEFVVYHEMLHADMGVEKTDARRTLHSREFRRREKLYKNYIRAAEWEKKVWG